MIFPILTGIAFFGGVLGNIESVRGKATIVRANDLKHISKPLPVGLYGGQYRIYIGDIIETESNSYVRGSYDGSNLVVGPSKKFTALQKGLFNSGKRSKYLIATKHMGEDKNLTAALDIWPPTKSSMPILYVEPNGLFTLSWLAPQDSKSITICLFIEDKLVASKSTKASDTTDGVLGFGSIEDKGIGLALYKYIKVNDVVPIRVVLTTDTKFSQTLEMGLVSKMNAQKWDRPVKELRRILDSKKDSDSDIWVEKLNDLLVKVEDSSPALCGYWLLKVWRKYPQAFATNDAMRALAEEAGLTSLKKTFEKRSDVTLPDGD